MGAGGLRGRALQVGVLTAGDMAFQVAEKKLRVRHLRWYYRGAAVLAVALVVKNNHEVGR